MWIRILTIFPGLFTEFLATSLVGRAIDRRLIDVEVHDLRDHTDDPHRSIDDEPYGGGGGMVMSAPPWIRAIHAVSQGLRPWRILLSPQGTRLDEARVRQLATRTHLVLLCGRYEGIDERVRQTVVDEEISIGDYVLAGGEVAAMVLVETLSRQIPGVVGMPESVEKDSFRRGLLDYPHYTRPADVDGLTVPSVLLSGNHREIELWRERQALRATLEKRADLLVRTSLTPRQEGILASLRAEDQVEEAPHTSESSKVDASDPGT